MGQSIGDFGSLISSAFEITGGSTMASAGVLVTAGTGGLATPVSVPATAAGAAITSHGIGVAGTSIYNLTSPKPGSRGGPGAGKSFPQSVKDQARSESGNKCVFCGKSTTRESGPTQSNIDHSIPKSQGGNNTIQNAQNTCRTCNLQKGAQTSMQFIKNVFSKLLK
jgi:hypothetical protein